MLLTDELENAYNEHSGDIWQLTEKLFSILHKRLPDGSQGVNKSLVIIKQIDNAWRFFCRSHKEFKPDGFRNLVIRGDKTGKIRQALNW